MNKAGKVSHITPSKPDATPPPDPDASDISFAEPPPPAVLLLYNPILEVLLDYDQLVLHNALLTLPHDELEPFSKAAAALMVLHSCFLSAIRVLFKKEVSECTTEATLLRSNSAATILASSLNRRLAVPFLIQVLRPVVKSLSASGRLCEINPAALPPNQANPAEEVASNLAFLSATLEQILVAVRGATSVYPRELSAVCRVIRAVICEHFPPAVADRVVRSFIFLRFICPVIVTPEQFHITKDPPPPAAKRSLLLISKVLQRIANGIEFNLTKEPYMAPCNKLIGQMQPMIAAFADDVLKVDAYREDPRDEIVLDALPLPHLQALAKGCRRVGKLKTFLDVMAPHPEPLALFLECLDAAPKD
jgi:hypothetical protein